MAPQDVAIDALLAAGVLCQLLCCVGVLVAHDVFDRLHYAGAGSTLGPLFILASILLAHGLTTQGLQTIAAVGILFVASPIVVHATARAARRMTFGHVSASAEERGERP